MWNKTKIEAAKAKRLHSRVALDALGRLSNDTRVLTCVIEDFSASGARLRFDKQTMQTLVGDEWTLSGTLVGAITVDLRWRNENQAGVSFRVDQEERAQLNKFVKALIRYGVSQAAYYPTADDRKDNNPANDGGDGRPTSLFKKGG